MNIDTKYIESLKPCKDRLNNWKEYHNTFSGSLNQFLDLENITHKDKLWVYFRSVSKDVLRNVVADFAESTLHLYESRYPNDNRPRLAIDACRNNIVRGEIRNAAAAYAAYADAAAYAAYAAYADAAAYAAYAAAYAAYAAAAAAYADAYADAAYADAAAAYAADKKSGRSQEENKQIQIMKKYLGQSV